MLFVGAGERKRKTWRVKGVEKVPKQIVFWMNGQESIFPLLKNAEAYQFSNKRGYLINKKDKKKNGWNNEGSMEPPMKEWKIELERQTIKNCK